MHERHRQKVFKHHNSLYFLGCSCPVSTLPPVEVKPGTSTAEVQWTIPVPSCLNNKMAMEKKHLSIGSHGVDYTYKLDNSLNMTCTVNVEVKGNIKSPKLLLCIQMTRSETG